MFSRPVYGNRRRVPALSLVLATAVVAGSPAEALGCSCAAPATPADALARSSAAFVGRVIDIDKPFLDSLGLTRSGLHDVTFRIDRAWKGVSGDTVVIRTRLTGESCGYRFDIGRDYLVYASGDAALITGICTGTRPAEGAEADFKALDRLAAPEN
jgi:hypothetical protein